MLTIYGTAASRAIRVLWMAGELGLDYEHEPIDGHGGGYNVADYLAINPNGRIPALRDGDFVLWESMAITLYLAQRHPGPLTPRGAEEMGLAMQWTFWAVTEIEPPLTSLIHGAEGAAADAARATLARPLEVLDAALADRDWLLGDRFTVADLNVAAVVRALFRFGYDFAERPALRGWLERCLARPAAQAAVALQRLAMAARR